MKRIISFLLLLTLVLSLLAACGGSFTCDICGEEKSGKKYEEDLLGETITYCSDCKQGLEALGDLFC